MRSLLAIPIAIMLAGSGTDSTTTPAPKAGRHCFSPAQFNGWRAADAKTLYIRADVSRHFRIDLARECFTLAAPDAQLILNVHGGGMICSAVDADVKVTQPFGSIPEPCFVKSMTELSPAEAAAIPQKLRP